MTGATSEERLGRRSRSSRRRTEARPELVAEQRGLEPGGSALAASDAAARVGGVARGRARRARRGAPAPATLEITGGLDTLCDVLMLRAIRTSRTCSASCWCGRGGGLRAPRLHREPAMPALNRARAARRAPRRTLVATGCGTAIACVCALGLGEIERRLGGSGRCWRSAARRCCARRWRARSRA
jgi:hypothetical protein